MLAVGSVASWDSERLWFGAEGFSRQFWRDTLWHGGSFAAAAAFFACALTLNSRLAWRIAAGSSAPVGLLPDGRALPRLIPLEDKLGLDRYRRRATALAIVCLSCAAGLAASNGANVWFRAHYAPPLGVADELWHWDLSFFLWKLPALEGLVTFVTMALWACLLLTVAIYVYEEALETGGRRVTAAPGAARHLGVLVALILAWRAAGFQVDICNLQSATGAYTGEVPRFVDRGDLYYILPFLRDLTLFSPCCGLLVGVLFWRRRGRLASTLALSYWTLTTLLMTMVPFWARGGEDDINPSSESNLLRDIHNKATLKAWGLGAVKPLPTTGLGTPRQLVPNMATWPAEAVEYEVERRLDSSSSGFSLTQLQLESWNIAGRVRPVYVAVCQQDAAAMPAAVNGIPNAPPLPQDGQGEPQAGIFLLDANLTDVDGEMVLYAQPGQKVTQEMAPVDAPDQKLLRADFPLLVGERGGDDDDSSPEGDNFSPIPQQSGSGRVDEPLPDSVDWRLLDGGENVGVPARGFSHKLPLALHFLSTRLLIGGGSRVVWHRRVADRCHQLVPYLDWGHGEPRLLLGSGSPVWTITGYSWSHRYPDAAPAPGPAGCNYSRATAIATIDGRTGAARFFLLDPSEPFSQVYASACPDLFSPLASMPAQVRRRLRGSTALFAAQSEIWAIYHETMGGRVPRYMPAPPANSHKASASTQEWELGLYPTYASNRFEMSLDAVRRIALPAAPGNPPRFLQVAAYSSNEKANREEDTLLPLDVCSMLIASDTPFDFGAGLFEWRPKSPIAVAPEWGREAPIFMKRGRPLGPRPTLITLLPSDGRIVLSRGERARDRAPAKTTHGANPAGLPAPSASPTPEPARLNQRTAIFSGAPSGRPDEFGRLDAPITSGEGAERALTAAKLAFQNGQIARNKGDWQGFGQSQDKLADLLNKTP